MSKNTPKALNKDSSIDRLLGDLRAIIREGRNQVLRAVDSVQVRTCWEIARHIVEFEQEGADRAEYGTRLIPRLAESLTAEFGKGFDEGTLWRMRAFYQGFPIQAALRPELSWHIIVACCG